MSDDDSSQHPLFWAGLGKDWGDYSVNHRDEKLLRGAWQMRQILAREIKKSFASTTGLFMSKRPGGDAKPTEGPLELAFYTCLDFDWLVDSFFPQPAKIEYVDPAGKPRAYFPDTLIFFNRDVPEGRRLRPLLVEVKKADSITKEGQLHEIQTAAGKAFADSKAYDYKILTEKEIYTPFWQNAKFLSRFGKYATDDRSHIELVGRLHSVLARKRRPAAMTILSLWEAAAAELLPAGASAEAKQNKILELMPCLYHEIQKGMIHVDLQVTVTPESLVSLPRGSRRPYSPFNENAKT